PTLSARPRSDRCLVFRAISGTGLEPHAAPAAVAVRPVVDQFDAGILERGDQFHQRIDVAPNHRLTRFHPLNGWYRKPRQLREPPLVDAEKHPGSPQLSRSDHQPDSPAVLGPI